MSSDLVEVFKSVGDVCEILGKLVGPLQRLAQELENNPTITTPKKGTRWTAADTNTLNEIREKYGDDVEKIHEALPKKQLHDIQTKLDKLKQDDKKRKQKDKKEGDSSDDQHKKKPKLNKHNGDTEIKSPPKKSIKDDEKVVQKKSTNTTSNEDEKATKASTSSGDKTNSDKAKPSKSSDKKITQFMKIEPTTKASPPVAPSPDLGDEKEDSDCSSDEFG